MITRETDSYVDIYPFVDTTDELPSARVSVYKERGEVTFQGDNYTPEDVRKLTEAFELAFAALATIQAQK